MRKDTGGTGLGVGKDTGRQGGGNCQPVRSQRHRRHEKDTTLPEQERTFSSSYWESVGITHKEQMCVQSQSPTVWGNPTHSPQRGSGKQPERNAIEDRP